MSKNYKKKKYISETSLKPHSMDVLLMPDAGLYDVPDFSMYENIDYEQYMTEVEKYEMEEVFDLFEERRKKDEKDN